MLYKRGSIWWVRLTSPDGKEIRRSAGTEDKARAQEWHDKLKASLWDQKRLGLKPERSWQEAVIRWIEERNVRPTTHDSDLSHARNLDEFLGRLNLSDITTERVNAIALELKMRGKAPGTINARLAFIRGIMRRAEGDWGWIDKVPRFRRQTGTERRLRWLTREEADRLLAELPEWLRAQARFTLATGLRASNVRNLEWKDVDLEKRIIYIHADQSKGRKSIGVPMNKDCAVLLREQFGKDACFVFGEGGKPGRRQSCREWAASLKRAGISNFRWHDLRHTWASWHVQVGTPLATLRELGGWSKFETVLIYSHLSPEHLAEHAGNIESIKVQRKRG